MAFSLEEILADSDSKIAQLIMQRSEIERLLDEEQSFNAGLRHRAGLPKSTAPQRGLLASALAQAQARTGETKSARIVAIAKELIRERKGALSARLILNAIDERGHHDLVLGKDHTSRIGALSALLSKHPDFEADRSLGGYYIAGEKPARDGNPERAAQQHADLV